MFKFPRVANGGKVNMWEETNEIRFIVRFL